MPRATAHVLEARGHDAADVRAMGLGTALDARIAELARRERRCLLTRDLGFADERSYPPAEYAGIVVFRMPPRVGRDHILALVRAFASMDNVLAWLPGRLAIIEPDRVRLRPAPPADV